MGAPGAEKAAIRFAAVVGVGVGAAVLASVLFTTVGIGTGDLAVFVLTDGRLPQPTIMNSIRQPPSALLL